MCSADVWSSFGFDIGGFYRSQSPSSNIYITITGQWSWCSFGPKTTTQSKSHNNVLSGWLVILLKVFKLKLRPVWAKSITASLILQLHGYTVVANMIIILGMVKRIQLFFVELAIKIANEWAQKRGIIRRLSSCSLQQQQKKARSFSLSMSHNFAIVVLSYLQNSSTSSRSIFSVCQVF